jgi:hypothetical protein
MIKKYLEFIRENKEDFNSLGEWVESLYSDEYIKNIVNRFIDKITPDIKLSNAINVLNTKEQADIKKQIEEYQKNGLKEHPEVKVTTSTEVEELLESEITIAGKGIFNSFLKALTALGQKNGQVTLDKSPDGFLLFYHYPKLISDEVKIIFSRFKSLSRYLEMIDYAKNEVDLYFGIKCDGNFEYGISYEESLPIGQFKLSQSVIKWIIQLDLKSAASLKKELVNLSYQDILLLGKIKTEMKDFTPGYHEQRKNPTLVDKVLSFGYYGLSGQWNNGKLDEGELLNIKNNFNNWILSKKWSDKVLISVKAQSFWLNIHIKLK